MEKVDQGKSGHNSRKVTSAHVTEAASDLLNEGKKMANDLYEEGKHRVHDAQEHIKTKVQDAQEHMKGYSNEIAHKVHEKPLTSLLIAGGIGFLLAAILRR